MDMLVNCAGTSKSGKFEELEVSSFEVSNNVCSLPFKVISIF